MIVSSIYIPSIFEGSGNASKVEDRLLGFWLFWLFWLFWFVMSNIQLILHLELSEGNSFKRGVTQID
ncbi:hypothetical protein C0R09_00630 [Brevibacillus laterosporus]|nr:hypothetical protein C0R09_00630 [Brevibacillus laterosporus]